MKLTKKYLKTLISEILRLNKDGEKEEFGPPEEIDAIYHDSTRDDNKRGYTSIEKKPIKVRIINDLEKEDSLNEEKIFDSTEGDEQHTFVYRLDKLTNRGFVGPYRIYFEDFVRNNEYSPEQIDKAQKQFKAIKKILDRFKKKVEELSPEKDFLEKEYSKKSLKRLNLFFGFQDLNTLYWWFPKKYVDKLKKHGFKIRKIKAKTVWLSKSQKQIVFEPLTSLDDGEIIK